jgi:hypothetical protein
VRIHCRPTRAKLVLVGCLVVLAGVVTAFAHAGTEFYCNDCTLDSSGAPAVSAFAYHTYNALETIGNADLHVYYYNASTGVQSCDMALSNTDFVDRTCANYGTARCHLLNGTGPREAGCRADSA